MVKISVQQGISLVLMMFNNIFDVLVWFSMLVVESSALLEIINVPFTSFYLNLICAKNWLINLWLLRNGGVLIYPLVHLEEH